MIQWKEVQDDLTFIRKYKKRKNPSGGGGGGQTTAKTSSSADSESSLAATAMSEDGAGGDGNDGDDDKKDDKVEAATVAAEMEVEDGTEIVKDIACLNISEAAAENSTDADKTEPPIKVSDPNKSTASSTENIDEEEVVTTSVCVPRTDFILGLADLTG